MFIAMNRFKVLRGAEAEFESAWRGRERRLDEMAGFRDFHLLKGPEAPDHTLYASHTMWASEADFIAWTKSEQFRAAHRGAGGNKPLFLGHPQFEGFTVLEGILMAAGTTLREAMAADPGAVFETVARDQGATCRAVVEALPAGMRRFAEGGFFVDAMTDIAQWGEVTFIVHTDDAIVEFTGAVPEGKVGRGYYNLTGRSGLHGHFRHERCASIAFVERPFMGRASAVVVFFNAEGGIMFKVFVGRTAKGDLRPEQLAAFRALAEAMVPVEA